MCVSGDSVRNWKPSITAAPALLRICSGSSELNICKCRLNSKWKTKTPLRNLLWAVLLILILIAGNCDALIHTSWKKKDLDPCTEEYSNDTSQGVKWGDIVPCMSNVAIDYFAPEARRYGAKVITMIKTAGLTTYKNPWASHFFVGWGAHVYVYEVCYDEARDMVVTMGSSHMPGATYAIGQVDTGGDPSNRDNVVSQC